MIRLLFGLLAAFVLFAQDAPKKLTADEMKAVISKTDNIYLLDVREPKELAETGTLKGAVNVPISDLEKRIAEVPKDRKILVFCAHGVRAGKGADLLIKNGYSNVIGVGGLAEWKEKQYEVVYPGK